ncbi:MAG: zinc-binding alcohol dehydrogenase [Opitutaceae bacterium]|jgi:2-desacetyl-2-hydroxyethyl bacteriochlorophyllide A dehydrogenase
MSPSSTRILFPTPGQARLDVFPRPVIAKPTDVLIETEYSIVSAGTELACRAGIEGWAPLPFCPGYGSVGRVIAHGDAVKDIAIGQRVLTFGKHAKHALADAIAVPVPEGLDPAHATFARMASIAITAVRVSEAELGDTVAVIGLGLVGNLAAQLFALSGCEVIGIDPSPARRAQAKACGITHVLASGPDVQAQVAALTAGRMCGTVVEATGLSVVALETAPALCGKQGEIVLLGSPRSPHTTDVTPFLSQLHLCRPTATVKGALEWRYPLRDDGEGFAKHSIERNVRQLLQLLAEGKLKVAPLLTHRASPADCHAVYEGLTNQKDIYTGVVFDWSKI